MADNKLLEQVLDEKAGDISLLFAADADGARLFAKVLNRLTVDIGLMAIVEEVLGPPADKMDWTGIFAARLDKSGGKTLLALAAIAEVVPLSLLQDQIKGGK